jgi:hypothetical protein
MATQNQVTDSVWPYVHLAAALGQLGRATEAIPVLAELGRRGPASTISEVRRWPHNLKRSADRLEHVLEGLSKAGLAS